MKLIVGLGNKGKEYYNTRHNIGFSIIDKLNDNNPEKEKMNGIYFEKNINGEKVIFLKPQLYMNLSGIVVKKYVDYFKIDLEDILIISDDMDMEVGKIRLRAKGSAGGHNGLKNIQDNLQTNLYKRLKVGISKPNNKEVRDFVLSKFSKEEQKIIDDTYETCIKIVEDFLEENFEKLMNKYN